MGKTSKYHIAVTIDRLTNSIVNVISGDSFQTVVLEAQKEDLKHVSRKNGWLFSWTSEFKFADRTVYKITICDNVSILQGLVSLSDMSDHYYMHLIENAPFNRGRKKLYEGVPGNLVAFACKCSKDAGYDGFIAFTSKTSLIEHYSKTLGAVHIGGHKMIIFPDAAQKLIDKYFQNS